MTDPTTRFSKRAATYAKHRPSYPKELIPLLVKETGLAPNWRIADVGSGTGILTQLLLQNGNAVYGIEPNEAMRKVAEATIGPNRFFKSVAGTAEKTTLEPGSVEMITCAQAYHWFEPFPTKQEFKRILKASGWCVLVWNTRNKDASPFMEGYEGVLTSVLPEYRASKASQRVNLASIESLFAPGQMKKINLKQTTAHNWNSLKGLLESASYVPLATEPGHNAVMEAMKMLFDRTNRGGKVDMVYTTEVYLGKL